MGDRNRFTPKPGPGWLDAGTQSYRAAFEHDDRRLSVGAEEELMLIDPATWELAPLVHLALVQLGDDRFTHELKESQLEITTPPCANAAELGQELAQARLEASSRLAGVVRLAAAGTHPFSTVWGEVARGARYQMLADEYVWAAQRSLPSGLHVHVAVADPRRALAVYNAVRSYLPELGALAANAPYVEGRDTGLCSVRPMLNVAFVRTGTPPAFRSWRELEHYVEWGRHGGLFPDPTHFWWDLRLHVVYGTLELRVLDAQTLIEDAAGVAAVFQTLVAALLERIDAGEPPPVHETHVIAENAWRAMRYGVGGMLADLETGDPEPTRERLGRLLDWLEPSAAALGNAPELESARTLVADNGADRQRYVAEREGLDGLVRWLSEQTESSARDWLEARAGT